MSGDDEDTERLVADIPADLKELVKADPRTMREIVVSSLQREFQTKSTAAVERRIDEKRSRINQLETEKNERKREIAKEQDELERLQRVLEQNRTEQSETEAEAIEALGELPPRKLTPDNEAVKNWANKTGLSRQRLIEKVEDSR